MDCSAARAAACARYGGSSITRRQRRGPIRVRYPGTVTSAPMAKRGDQAIDTRGRHFPAFIGDHVGMPQRWIGDSLKFGSSTRIILCMATTFSHCRLSLWTRPWVDCHSAARYRDQLRILRCQIMIDHIAALLPLRAGRPFCATTAHIVCQRSIRRSDDRLEASAGTATAGLDQRDGKSDGRMGRPADHGSLPLG